MALFGDTNFYYDDPEGVIAWDGARVVRCPDILATPPVWVTIDSGISGTIIDGQLVITDDGTAVLWLLTSAAVFVCRDAKAAVPTWETALAIATVQASDANPTPQASEFKCFATYQSDPAYCIVATGPTGGDSDNAGYHHAYFWHTHNYGAAWTSVDVGGTTGTGGNSFVFAGRLAMEIYPEAVSGNPGTIWCVRTTPTNTLNFDVKVFRSLDGGHNWTISTTDMQEGANSRQLTSLLGPVGAASNAAYVVNGGVGASDRPDIRRSSDNFDTVTVLTSNGDPVGYGGVNVDATAAYQRLSRRFNDPTHLLAWLRRSSDGRNHLFESENSGDDFTLLYSQTGSQPYNGPVNWPPDPELWIWAINRGTNLAVIANAVLRTVDHFANVVDASGNLEALIGTWVAGVGGCLFLPKDRRGLDASLVTFMRVQAAAQSTFGEAETPTFGLPVVFEYEEGDQDHVAEWDPGKWTPTAIVERVAQAATFTLRGVLFFELLPLFLDAGFNAMTPSGGGPFTYEDAFAPGAVGDPIAYTFRFGGNDGGRSPTSMVQVQDAYLRSLALTFNPQMGVVTFESKWFGRFIDDNEGSGYEPEAVGGPGGLAMVNGLLATLGLQDAGDSGGAFDAITQTECALVEWQIAFDTGLRPAWASDQSSLTYCGARQEWPAISFTAQLRTNIDTYAVTKVKANQHAYQELQLAFYDAANLGDRSFVLRLTGRWLPGFVAHERNRGEIVCKPTFQAETPATQTTTPHWASWEIVSGWEHGA